MTMTGKTNDTTETRAPEAMNEIRLALNDADGRRYDGLLWGLRFDGGPAGKEIYAPAAGNTVFYDAATMTVSFMDGDEGPFGLMSDGEYIELMAMRGLRATILLNL
jgi:hypothetical protein